jgi:hemolysin III
MVFILIATTYNVLSVLPGGGRAIIWIGWIGAVFGVLQKVVFFELVEKGPKWITSIPYLVLGWCSLWELQRISYYSHFCGVEGILICFIGGVAVTVGAVCYSLKKPNLWPGVFGHHEILHLGVIVAVYCFYFCFDLVLQAYPERILSESNKFQ